MILKFDKRYVQALVVMVCVSLASCNQDVRPRQLDGKWELKSVNNINVDPGTPWEFEKDGDFEFCSPASVELPSPAPPASKSTASPFQPRLSWALIGGIQYWHQNDKNNPNTFYLSPFPSYSFSPQVSWQFQPQRSLRLGYRNQTLEDLFDYEGTRISEKFLKDVVVGEVVNSLTNARVAEVRKYTFVQVTQYNRELRYNQFQLHTLYFTFDQKLWVRDRAFLQVSAGINYLLRLRAQGKRLYEQRAVRAFQYGDERFRNHRFALQLGLRYQLQLLPQWQLIAQLDGQQYLNDWERNPALRNRPLLYGLSIGVGGHF